MPLELIYFYLLYNCGICVLRFFDVTCEAAQCLYKLLMEDIRQLCYKRQSNYVCIYSIFRLFFCVCNVIKVEQDDLLC